LYFISLSLSGGKKKDPASKRRLPLEPRAAWQLLKAESARVFRRLKMGPREFFNKANKFRASSVLSNEIADALAVLTNLDVVAEDPVTRELLLAHAHANFSRSRTLIAHPSFSPTQTLRPTLTSHQP
jgi:hypothetical protein